jgi:cysteinyl-tRNA synthetase
MHNGMLRVNGEKMSKSLGNFLTVRDALAKAPAEAVRLLLLHTHYRAELDFTDAALDEARRELDRWYRALEHTPTGAASGEPASEVPEPVLEALCDDLNTPLAIARLHPLADAALAGDATAAAGLAAAGGVLGLLQQQPAVWFHGGARQAARKNRDFARADAIRKELEGMGIVLEDGPRGTIWRRA